MLAQYSTGTLTLHYLKCIVLLDVEEDAVTIWDRSKIADLVKHIEIDPETWCAIEMYLGEKDTDGARMQMLWFLDEKFAGGVASAALYAELGYSKPERQVIRLMRYHPPLNITIGVRLQADG